MYPTPAVRNETTVNVSINNSRTKTLPKLSRFHPLITTSFLAKLKNPSRLVLPKHELEEEYPEETTRKPSGQEIDETQPDVICKFAKSSAVSSNFTETNLRNTNTTFTKDGAGRGTKHSLSVAPVTITSTVMKIVSNLGNRCDIISGTV